MVSTIGTSAKSLLGVINDILDLSKIEAGKVSIEKRAFSLHRCVQETVDVLAESARRKGLALELRIAPDTPDSVIGDAGRIRQVFLNLIGNGIKFTDKGSVTVRVTSVPAGGASARVRFEVRDTGIGIDAAVLTKLCTPFEQADSSITRRFGGTGLGLSISRHLVELMDGRLEVDSAAGIGTRVAFELPLELATGAASRSRGRRGGTSFARQPEPDRRLQLPRPVGRGQSGQHRGRHRIPADARLQRHHGAIRSRGRRRDC